MKLTCWKGGRHGSCHRNRIIVFSSALPSWVSFFGPRNSFHRCSFIFKHQAVISRWYSWLRAHICNSFPVVLADALFCIFRYIHGLVNLFSQLSEADDWGVYTWTYGYICFHWFPLATSRPRSSLLTCSDSCQVIGLLSTVLWHFSERMYIVIFRNYQIKYTIILKLSMLPNSSDHHPRFHRG